MPQYRLSFSLLYSSDVYLINNLIPEANFPNVILSPRFRDFPSAGKFACDGGRGEVQGGAFAETELFVNLRGEHLVSTERKLS